MTQKTIIRKHLIEGGTITQRQAFVKYNITRLSAIIYYLRKTMKILDERIWTGEGYESRYYIIKEETC